MFKEGGIVNQETLGFILNKLRIESGMRQEDVANTIGIDQYRISEIERDYKGKTPRVVTLVDFLDAIGYEFVIQKKPNIMRAKW